MLCYMERGRALRVLSGYAASQWGLVTTSQAHGLGVDQVTLLRLREADLLQQVGHGVYLVGGAVSPNHLDIKVAWLRLDPAIPGWERRNLGPNNGTVSHRSACILHRIGDIPAPEVEFTVPRRRVARDPGVRFHREILSTGDVTSVDGLPVTTVERTVLDLLKSRADGGHVGGVVVDADRRGMIDLERLAQSAAQYGNFYGVDRKNGMELLRYLASLSGERLHDQELALAFLDGVEAQRVVPSEVLEPLTQAIEAASGPRSSHIPSGSLRHATHVTRQLDTDFAVAIRAAQAAMPTREILEAIQQASRAAQTAMPSREILEAIQHASRAAQPAMPSREILEAIP